MRKLESDKIQSFITFYEFYGTQDRPSLLETAGLPVPVQCIKDFALLNVCSSSKNCPCAKCASTAYVVHRDNGVFVT
jgi:hypothetical protein